MGGVPGHLRGGSRRWGGRIGPSPVAGRRRIAWEGPRFATLSPLLNSGMKPLLTLSPWSRRRGPWAGVVGGGGEPTQRGAPWAPVARRLGSENARRRRRGLPPSNSALLYGVGSRGASLLAGRAPATGFPGGDRRPAVLWAWTRNSPDRGGHGRGC